MRKILEILTPENVFVEYELAGLGSRGIAYFIDFLIKSVLTILASLAINFLIDPSSISSLPNSKVPIFAGIGFLILFIINMGYFIIFEMLMSGQTPGKKIMKLRVIRENGEIVTFFDFLLRNLLRILENTLTLNILGALFIIFSPNYKRIGDYAAGTIVIKLQKEKALSAESLLKQVSKGEGNEGLINSYPVDNFEYGILRDFLARKDSLGSRKQVFEYHLNKYFMDKFMMDEAYKNPCVFFEDILRMNSGI